MTAAEKKHRQETDANSYSGLKAREEMRWIAVPTVALAGDCPDDKGWYCVARWAFASPLVAAAVGALLASTALWRAWNLPSAMETLAEMEAIRKSNEEGPPYVPPSPSEPRNPRTGEPWTPQSSEPYPVDWKRRDPEHAEEE